MSTTSSTSSTTAPSTGPAYTALGSGLASGMDDSSIIASLVAIRQSAITQLQDQTSTEQTQVSDLGAFASDLTSVQNAMDSLTLDGVVSTAVTSNNTSFTATAGTGASAGEYQVQVNTLATSASAQSAALTGSQVVKGTTLNFTVQNQSYGPLVIADGSTLAQVAQQINGLGAPLSAIVINTGTSQVLQLTDTETGNPIGYPNSALVVSEDDSGSGSNVSLNLDPTDGNAGGSGTNYAASNASITLNSTLNITQTSNTITGVIPGVTLNLNTQGGPPENLVVAPSATATATNLQAFITAYNQLNINLQTQLQPSSTTNSDGSTSIQPAPLTSDASIVGLEQELQGFLTSTVSGVSGFNSLASIGITPDETTGALSINQTLLANAVNTNPSAVNQLFALPSVGLGAVFDGLANSYVDPVQGIFTQEESTLSQNISSANSQVTEMQQNLQAYQAQLEQQFSQMESLVSGYKSTGNYLTQLSDAALEGAPGGNG